MFYKLVNSFFRIYYNLSCIAKEYGFNPVRTIKFVNEYCKETLLI